MIIKPDNIYYGDCLELMPHITKHSIDMILCDLPYGITACKWDQPIPLEPLWEQYKRIIKNNGAIVLTGCQPFTSRLVMSNLPWFKYELIWEKTRGTDFMNAKKRCMRFHENLLVFYNKLPTYNPQMMPGKPYKKTDVNLARDGVYGRTGIKAKCSRSSPNGGRYPSSVLKISNTNDTYKIPHPTLKPVSLFEYLIKTFTNPGDLVLDNCAGAGTTGIAALNTGRRFILMEKNKNYFELAKTRIANCSQRVLPLIMAE